MSGAAGTASRWLMTAGLIVSMASGVVGLSPVRLGVWGTTEAIGTTLHLGALLAAIGLAGQALRWPAAVLAMCRVPVVLVPLLLAAWSALVAPAAEYPWLAIFGAPQTSEGALLFLDMAIWSAATLLLRDERGPARLIAAAAVLLALTISLLFLNPATRVYFYSDWMAFYGLFAPAIVIAMIGAGLSARIRWGLAALTALVPLAVSQNLTAIAAALVVGPVLLALEAWSRQRPPADRAWRPALMVGVAAIPVAGLLAIWLAGRTDLMATLWSRMLAAKVALATFTDAPLRWLTGQGWGHDVFTLLRQLDQAGQIGLDQTWDLAQRDYFHSHHGVLEGLISAGIPGALLFAALPVAVIAGADRRWRGWAAATAVAYALTTCLWFQTPATFAFQAVAFAALARRPIPDAGPVLRPAASRRLLAVAAPALFAAMLLAAVTFLAGFGMAAHRAIAASDVRVAAPPPAPCATFPAEAWRGHLGLARLYGSHIYGAENLARREGWSADLRDRLAAFVCLAERRSDESNDVYLLFWGLDLRGRLAHLDEFAAARPFFAPLLANWADRLAAFLALAPGRSDVAVGYFGWAIKSGDRDAAVALGNRMLSRRPDDAIALWFSGNAMLLDPDDQVARQGLARMKRALALGIERLVPIDASLRDRLVQLSPR
jgi:hypothetical protein